MPKITLENVTKRWGGFYGADHLNMVIEDNNFDELRTVHQINQTDVFTKRHGR